MFKSLIVGFASAVVGVSLTIFVGGLLMEEIQDIVK